MLRAALAITGGRREAEDLVQDAFVRLMLAKKDLASIEHPDAYLRTVLRNLHTARLRRRAQQAETPLTITEFDSAQFAARALTPSQWTQARHDVAAACRYACTRRLTSKTGSLFLLRFVHELVPSDIARVARLTRDTVDITLMRARAEVKAYLERPAQALEALDGALLPMSMPAVEGDADADHDYLARIREAVFALRHARCFDAARLERLYAPASGTAIPTPILAELVTCPRCLDHVSRLVQVPPSAEWPSDQEPPSDSLPPPPRRLPTRDTTRTRRAAATHASRAVRAHRPRLLRVLVNGFEIGTHEISGTAARVTQTVSTMEPVWLVEVFSEQDVCLASLDVAPLPEAPAEQRVSVELADERRIELALSFLRQWPTVQLAYEDPAYVAPSTEFAAAIPEDEETALDPGPSVPSASPWPTFQWRVWSRWTQRRPPRLAWVTVVLLVVGWLFFFTPGTSVSAAERLWRAIVSIVAREPTPAPMPRSAPVRQQDISLPPPPTPRAPVSTPAASALTPSALAELEVDALTALHARHALVGQRIQVTRTPSSVAVEGLVEGQNRDDLVRALRAVPHGAALSVNLSTPAELLGSTAGRTSPSPSPSSPSSSSSSSSTVRSVALDRDAVPAADDLRRAIMARPAGAVANVEAEIHRLANDGLRDARASFLEAATLSTLAARFDAARASDLLDSTSTKWRTLLAEQVDRVARAVDQLRSRLEPVFVRYDQQATSPSGPAAGAADDRRVSDEARRIAEDLREVERAASAALAVAETAPATIELREAAFWRRLAATRDRIAALKQHLIAP